MTDLPAGRELDALVAEKVMGWTKVPPPSAHESAAFRKQYREYTRERALMLAPPDSILPGLERSIPYFSTDIAAAWLVVEKMDGLGWYLTLDRLHDKESGRFWRCEWMRYTEENERCGDCWEDGETPTLAICRAALEAVGV